MPSPSPIKRQLFRSSRIPLSSRGYQANGADILLPSMRSMTRLSSVTATRRALASRTGVFKEFIFGVLLAYGNELPLRPRLIVHSKLSYLTTSCADTRKTPAPSCNPVARPRPFLNSGHRMCRMQGSPLCGSTLPTACLLPNANRLLPGSRIKLPCRLSPQPAGGHESPVEL